MGGAGRYYAILSGLYERLARAELEAILEVEARGSRVEGYLEGAAVILSQGLPAERVVGRAAYVKEVGLLLGVAEASIESLLGVLESLADALRGSREPFRVELSRYKGYSRGSLPHDAAVRLAVSLLEKAGVPLNPRSRRVLRIHVTEGAVLVGVALARLNPKPFQERRPRMRPFFKPGPLDPQLSRALVNLSRLERGRSVYLDPFCGTGGFALEACLLGARKCVCSDIDRVMAEGARVNLDHYGCRGVLVAQADAARIPLASGSVDSIATDPPYGRSTTLAKRRREDLYRDFLSEASRVLARGGWLVFAAPVESRPRELAAEAGFRVVDYVEMYVHSSLTRGIVVARRP
ncbi:RsmD family RNA methyltransferase [Stetteria hydrogenophila]